MAFCPKCGTKVDSSASFCPKCGARLATPKNDFSEELRKLADTPDTTDHYDPRDIESNKLMGILCYLSILWLVPYFTTKDSPFVRFHLNQGLTVLIIGLVGACLQFIPVVGWLVSVAAFALSIIGIVNVVSGKVQELPLVGKYTLMK